MKQYQRFIFYEDEEAYLNRMSLKGYQFKDVEDGYYEFEKKAERNYYRMAYIYNLDEEQFERWKQSLEKDCVEFVVRKGIWAFFKSDHPFHLYNASQQKEIRKHLVSSYKKTGYGFLLGAIAFELVSLVAGRSLYVGVILFSVIGLRFIYLASKYENKGRIQK
ncbi:MAG: DUF2812 domain-containing protein [Firmicutes bacterium]|nr:DUF2812 domain-containing protein [Bacillota bacterium]